MGNDIPVNPKGIISETVGSVYTTETGKIENTGLLSDFTLSELHKDKKIEASK